MQKKVIEENKNNLNLRDANTHKELLRNYYSTQNFSLEYWTKIEDLIEQYVDR